ncbi:d-arabinono-1,4-lactone oxidase domain-containing protein [Ditylenchus destructor]|nr:d-arabinono-1,4-lactone oxidase domain-containing protein [Ditylenchus destructor]
MARLLPLLFVLGLFLLEEVGSLPFVRIGAPGGFHPFVKWICPKCVPSISFSTIADCTDTIISTLHLNAILGLDPSVPSVTVEGGITYTDLAPFLESVGFAIPNLASLAEISVAGAAQTGAHGSGVTLGNLATHIRSLKIVLANGTLATYGPNNPELKAIALGLGLFGVIVQVELNIQPTFKLKTHVFMNMPQESVYNHFDEIENMGYTVQFFTDFSNLTHWTQVWINVKTDHDTVGGQQQLFGAPKAPGQVTPITALPSTYTMEQNKEQPWYYGLVDYRLGLSGFDGAEIQTEWIMPYKNAVPALKAVSKLGAEIAPKVYTMLIRTIEADDLWMSAEYQERSVAIHFTWQPNMTAVLDIIPKIEAAIKPYKARPHWAKVYTNKPSDFLQYYPKLKDFKNLVNKLDPNGKFRNAYVNKNVLV